MERVGLAPGTPIGGYTVVAPLGSGGMGAVYRAVDDGGATVALKLLHPEVGADPVARARLNREVAALQRLRHPAVARVLDAEADSTEAFLVTELVQGEPLDARVRRTGALRGGELVDLAVQLQDALDAVHSADVVHRDLKPSNVMMTQDGPVLIDFGLALAHDDVPLTATSVVAGSPGYLAPELLDGAEPSPEIDWWGWAAVLAFAATGRPPFGGGSLGAVLGRTRAGDVDLEGLPYEIEEALAAALAPDPLDRPEPDELIAALNGETSVKAAEGPQLRDEPTEKLHVDESGRDGHTQVFETPGYEAPPAAPRWGTLLALCVVVAAGGMQFPLLTVGAVILGVVVFRSVGSALEAMYERRNQRGVRRRDVPMAISTAPWHLVLGLAGALPSIVVASAVISLIAGPLWWLTGRGNLRLTTAVSGEVPVGTGVGVVVGGLVLGFALVAWFGPISVLTRVGARRTLAGIAPKEPVRWWSLYWQFLWFLSW